MEIRFLNGIRVLNFTHYLQGPLAAQLIADLGADVIKVESLKGAHERWTPPLGLHYGRNISISHVDRNRNMRSVSADLKTKEGHEFISRLIDSADVIMENFRPGVMEKYGFGYEQLKLKNPKLVYVSMTGWGADGPYAKKPGQDLLAQGASGFSFGTGKKGEAPVAMGVPIIDTMGAMTAAYGTLAAIIDSIRTGQGHFVDSCLLNAAIELLSDNYPLYFASGGRILPRVSTGLISRYYCAPYGAYQTKDGYMIVSNTSIDAMKQCFGEKMNKFTEENALENREEIDKLVSESLKTKTTDEWMEILEAHNAWCARILNFDEVKEDPQVKNNGIFMDMNHPVAGKVTVVNNPIRFDGENVTLKKMPPLLGEHTIELMKECGYSNEEIQDYIDKKAVRADSY